MEKDNKVFLKDILNACEKIISYTKDLTFEDFEEDELTQDAVLRNIEVIGEASAKLTTTFIESNPDFPLKEAKGMRNKVIHEYRNVEIDVVWQTVAKDIPQLYEIVKGLVMKV